MPVPLAGFKVIDSIEIEPARVEADKIISRYILRRGAATHFRDLTYKYEESIGDIQDPAVQNLANLVTAQVAINYGLFAERLVFHGALTKADQNFIRRMANNTAREIYVQKLLFDNPFIKPEFKDVTVEYRRNYLQAELVFPETYAVSEANWSGDREKIGVLASGGKDSLLSYALLKDAGYDVHPIFINESGRHWFTALNAYREFVKFEPNTSRVWTDSDRLFNWVARQLPFIRDNYQKLRADIYPIRLWTVAVFLFGALPIARKRGLGRVVIGNEFDTTLRSSYQHITHYHGLFDQSLFFDRALSRFYRQKHWPLAQFSILRPLSEPLIQKTLISRYPELYKLQVSCHAAHLSSGKALPCGNCEKCRRIVTMALAFGADPEACGYNKTMQDHCLKQLSSNGLHQESAGVEHLAYLLQNRGLLPSGAIANSKARAHDQIMSFRIDEDCSPIASVPGDIRQRVWSQLLPYAGGILVRSEGTWSKAPGSAIL